MVLKCLWCGKVYNIGFGLTYTRKCGFCNGSLKLRKRYLRRLERKKKVIRKIKPISKIKKGLSIQEQHIYNLIKRVCKLANFDIQNLDLTHEFNYDKSLDYEENKNRVLQLLRDKGILTKEIEIELNLFDFDSSFERFLNEYKDYYGIEYEQG